MEDFSVAGCQSVLEQYWIELEFGFDLVTTFGCCENIRSSGFYMVKPNQKKKKATVQGLKHLIPDNGVPELQG